MKIVSLIFYWMDHLNWSILILTRHFPNTPIDWVDREKEELIPHKEKCHQSEEIDRTVDGTGKHLCGLQGAVAVQ